MWYDRLQNPDGKFHFHIELTTKCNAACPMCPRFIKSTPVRTHNIELWEMTIDKVKKWFPVELIQKIGSINFCGNFGDPCSCRDIYEIVEYFHTNNPNIKIDIRTNGGAQPVTFWKKIGKMSSNSKSIRLVFSVDGLEDTNDLYRRNVKWDILDRNIRAYTESGGYGVQEFLIFNHNEHQISAADEQAEEWGLDNVTYKQAHGFEDYHEGKQKPFPVYDKKGHLEYFLKPSLEYTNSSLEYDENVDTVPTFIHIDSDLTPNSKIPIDYDKFKSVESNTIECQAAVTHGGDLEVYFNANGDVRPCCHTGVDIDRNINSVESLQLRKILSPKKLFNLNTNSIDNILKLFDERFVEKWEDNHNDKGRCVKCSIQCGRVNGTNSERLYGADYKIREELRIESEIEQEKIEYSENENDNLDNDIQSLDDINNIEVIYEIVEPEIIEHEVHEDDIDDEIDEDDRPITLI